jgi:hypothetical protein
MDAVECTHCQVTMTSWATAGSPVRYFQCPLCARTYCSQYDEVFRARAGARMVGVPARQVTPASLPMASPEAQHWATVRARAARWFSRLEADQRLVARALPPARAPERPQACGLAYAAARPARQR